MTLSLATSPTTGQAFVPLALRADLALRWDEPHPTLVRAWRGTEVVLEPDGTHFVYAVEGDSVVTDERGQFPLRAGMFGALVEGKVSGASSGAVQAAGGTGLVVTRLGVWGMFQLGGPIEPRGRLRYIDGCTDTVLVPPLLRGEPCLNHLHIPAGTRQSRHTHPSVRIGVVARGRGRCVTPEGEHPLVAGLAFLIAPDAPHSFFTDEESLDVVVYHPDSDTGPTHEDHPMINRTITAGWTR